MEVTTPSKTAKAPAGAFTGDVYVNPIKQQAEPSRLIASIVRFTPGARTNWHSHALGQTLFCMSDLPTPSSRLTSVSTQPPSTRGGYEPA